MLASHEQSDVASGQSRRCFTATSPDNLPGINQRREVEADDIHLQFDSIVVVNHGAHDGILDFAVVQVYSDLVADLELPLVWLLCGWHGKECIKNRSRSREQSAERQARSFDVENVCDLGRECEG